VRDEYLAVQRRMTDLRVRLSSPPGTTFPDDGLHRAVADGGAAALARLARLEAGEPVIVRGDQVGMGAAYNDYVIEGDGRLIPVEAVRDPDYPSVKTVRGWRRPDGSLVRE
jgi:hypothetical protein